MTPAEFDARIVKLYHVLLSETLRLTLRLTHAAPLAHAHANNEDPWPKRRGVIRIARFYRLTASAVGPLCHATVQSRPPEK